MWWQWHETLSVTDAHKDSCQTAIFESNKLRASTYLPFFVLPGCNFFATGPDGGATGFGSPKPEFDAGDGSRRI
jgi:hypothetical protein